MDGYDYTKAGFDKFFNRSVDGVLQSNLDAPGPVSTINRYEDIQNTGPYGDKLRIGNILIDGQSGNISLIINDQTLIDLGELNNGPGIAMHDANNLRLLFGTDSKGDIKGKLSQIGYDADSASDDNIIWSSDYDMLKVAQVIPPQTITGTDNSASGLWSEITQVIPHPLGKVPIVFGFVLGTSADHSGESRIMPTPIYFSSASAYPFQMFIRAHADKDNVYVHLDEGPSVNWSSLSTTYKLYLMLETAA